MENLPDTSVLLFSYGMLQDRAVQLANFGRELSGRPDAIVDFQIGPSVRLAEGVLKTFS